MDNCNKYGLSRYIEASIKTVVRKRDGFGCVHCGLGFYTYEHFNPPFKDARVHEVNGIALLCGQCQLKTTKGILSKTTIQEDVNNPFCKRSGFTNEYFDLSFPILIYFGNFEYYASKDKDYHEIIKLNNEVILSCNKDPEGGPMQLSALFRDKNNKVCLEINKNEWKANSSNWDILQIGRKLIIFHAIKEIGIEIEVFPPHKILFNKIITYYKFNKLLVDKEKILMKTTDGKESSINTDYQIRRSAPINLSF